MILVSKKIEWSSGRNEWIAIMFWEAHKLRVNDGSSPCLGLVSKTCWKMQHQGIG